MSQVWKLWMCSDRVFTNAWELRPADTPSPASSDEASVFCLIHINLEFDIFIKFFLVNHSINNVLKVPYSIYGQLLLFFFHWKVSMFSDLKKNPAKNIRALGNLQFWTTCQSTNNIKTSLVKQNKMAQQGYQSHEWQRHILNYVHNLVFKLEILSKVPSVVTCHKFNTKKVQSYK